MPDIDTWMEDGTKSCHTDGVGTISPELGDMIWAVMCEASSNYRVNRVKPSAVRCLSVYTIGIDTFAVSDTFSGLQGSCRD